MTRPRHFINPYRYYDDFARDAWASGDEQKQRIAQIYRQARNSASNEQTYNYSVEGLQLAQQFDYPYWELFFRLNIYLSGSDYPSLTDDLIQMSVDITQPTLIDCSYNVIVYRELLRAYSRVDPLGQAENILQGCTYIEDNMELDRETYVQLPEFRSRVQMAQRRMMDAYSNAQEYFVRAQEEYIPYYMLHASVILIELQYRLGLSELALSTVQQAEKTARNTRQMSWLKTIIRWYLVFYTQADEPKKLQQVVDELNAMRDELTIITGARAIIAFHQVRDDRLELLADYLNLARDSHIFKNRYLEIEMRLEYYACLKQTNPFNRWQHFGKQHSRYSGYMTDLANMRNTSAIPSLILLPFIYIVYGLLLAEGCVMDVFLKRVHDIRQAFYDLVEDSNAKAIYHERIYRVDAGDYTLLS